MGIPGFQKKAKNKQQAIDNKQQLKGDAQNLMAEREVCKTRSGCFSKKKKKMEHKKLLRVRRFKMILSV